MPDADEQKSDGGFDSPPPPRLSKLLLAVAVLTILFVLFALGARLLLNR